LELELPRPADAGELRLVLERGAVVQGRVTTAEGEPVPAVRVAVEGAGATTGDDGFYWLEGAAPGARGQIPEFVHLLVGPGGRGVGRFRPHSSDGSDRSDGSVRCPRPGC